MNTSDFIWIDGKFVPWKDAKIHLLSHSLHYGTGVFEGIRCYETLRGPAIFCLKEHIERLFNSAKFLGIKIPFSKKELEKSCVEIIRVNKLPSAYIRPIVFYSYGKMGLDPTGAKLSVAIAAWPWGAYLGEENLAKGVTATICSVKRFSGSHNEAKITGNYFNSMRAHSEAAKKGFDEAIMLDEKGNIAEGPGENIFVIKNKKVFTPKRGAILFGITRNVVIQIGKDLGYKVKEKIISVRELKSADEAFFTGTAAEITPIRKVDKTTIGFGRRGPITEEIQSAFYDIVKGKNKRYQKWLTYC